MNLQLSVILVILLLTSQSPYLEKYYIYITLRANIWSVSHSVVVTVCIPRFLTSAFSSFFFFFLFFCVNSNLTWVYCSYTVWYCLCIKNIKNGSHDTIYIFKNYFAIVFLVFNFQFSATINSIQTDPLNISHVKKKKT